MKTMTPEETRRFLLDVPRTAKLSTVRPDGRPHITPIWIDLDGDQVVFTTWHKSIKAANLLHDPHVALCVDDDQPPFAYVIVEGTVMIDQHAPDLLKWSTRLAGRYMGADLAEAYGRRNAVEGEWLIRIVPTKIIASKGIAD